MTKRDRMMILGVLVVVLLGGFWLMLLSPQRKATAEAETQVATAQAALDAAQQKLTAGKQAQEKFRRDRTDIVKLGRVVPETDDVPTLLTQLQAIADRHDVKFVAYAIDSNASASQQSSSSDSAQSTTPTETGTRSTDSVAPLYAPGSIEIDGGLGRTPIVIELRGTYFNLEKYLRAVQRFAVLSAKQTTTNGRLVIVDGFSYDRAESGDPTSTKVERNPTLTAELSASVYFAPPLETPSPSAAPSSGSTPTPASSSSPSTSTGAAAVGGLR